MNVGIVGMGKLGLPVALAIESKGHSVSAFDINPNVAKYLKNKAIPFKEKNIENLLKNNTISMCGVEEIVATSDIIFCAVQTPHEPQFEGSTRIPKERRDFDYSYLKNSISEISSIAQNQKRHVTLIVISTCLPGTYKREIARLLNEYVHYVYNPFFIAMGQVVDDFLNPEFVLLGFDDLKHEGKEKTEPAVYKLVSDFYSTLHDKKHVVTDITTAEAIKVSYNTFITMKTVLANVWGELSHKLGANVDDIFEAWSFATDRLISPKYLKSGVGDGGGCHPRDNIALSFIANKVGLSHNIFEDLMAAREDHMDWLARLAIKESQVRGLPLIILGRSFKPETNIETGSPSVLMANIINKDYGYPVEHVEDKEMILPAVYFIGTMHDRYKQYEFSKDSVVIDPFRYIESKDAEVISIGRN